MGKTTALRRELRSTFLSHLQGRGFTLDERDAPTFWILRRPNGSSADLLSVQWEKYGRPRFRVDFGSCPIDGMTVAGKHFVWKDIHPHWLDNVCSLKPRAGVLTGTWFRQDRSLPGRILGASALRPASEVVQELMLAYPDVEAFWAVGARSKRIRAWTRK